MKKILLIPLSLWMVAPTLARNCHLPSEWHDLCRILNARVSQSSLKMKLQPAKAAGLENFLRSSPNKFPRLTCLQALLPKTTLELLIAVHNRGLSGEEAQLMAEYLTEITNAFQFQNRGAFDENTSHIIGREWHEIDYSGEGMTWQKQKAHYAPYGISHFKSKSCLEKFFQVESKLPYFRKIYQPWNLNVSQIQR